MLAGIVIWFVVWPLWDPFAYVFFSLTLINISNGCLNFPYFLNDCSLVPQIALINKYPKCLSEYFSCFLNDLVMKKNSGCNHGCKALVRF